MQIVVMYMQHWTVHFVVVVHQVQLTPLLDVMSRAVRQLKTSENGSVLSFEDMLVRLFELVLMLTLQLDLLALQLGLCSGAQVLVN